jgi:hypothetical protein
LLEGFEVSLSNWGSLDGDAVEDRIPGFESETVFGFDFVYLGKLRELVNETLQVVGNPTAGFTHSDWSKLPALGETQIPTKCKEIFWMFIRRIEDNATLPRPIEMSSSAPPPS